MEVDMWGAELPTETAVSVFVLLDLPDLLSVATTSKHWNSLVYVALPRRKAQNSRCHVEQALDIFPMLCD
jgi:hypothetical protein